eukprot:12579942-Alexandrium_andersonii.AAC.1
MSASLVGSEMCIRDSHRTRGQDIAVALCGRVARQFVFAQQHGDSGIAVSYTHLTLPTICSV